MAKNLESIFERIENKTEYPLPNDIKKHYLKEFKNHREKLERLLEKEQVRLVLWRVT